MEKFERINDTVSLLKSPFCGSWSGVVLVRRKNGDAVLIDSGANTETADAVLLPALRAEGLGPDSLTALLCTHTHGNTTSGSAPRFRSTVRRRRTDCAGSNPASHSVMEKSYMDSR